MNTEKPEHNPDGLTPEQVGAPEWCLLTLEEIHQNIEHWSAHQRGMWYVETWHNYWSSGWPAEGPFARSVRRRATPIPASEKPPESPEKDAETDKLFGDLFGPEEDWTPNQRTAAKHARLLEADLKEANLTINAQHSLMVSAEKRGAEKAESELRAQLTAKDAIIGELAKALTELRAQVRGECPSLLNEDSGGDGQLDIEIDAALTRAKEGASHE